MDAPEGFVAARQAAIGPTPEPTRERSPWPAWVRHTLSAAVGVALAAFAFQDIKRDAADAKRDVGALTPRVTAVEIKVATDGAQAAERYANLLAQINALIKTQDEQRFDTKEILRRLPK